MEQSIYRYILRHSLRQQIWLTVMAGLSFPFLYAFYELPKLIINEAVQGDVGGGYPVTFLGQSFSQTGYLFVLCAIFLALVLVNQGFKYTINVYRGLTGERMLRRLRYQLFGRVLRFPLAHRAPAQLCNLQLPQRRTPHPLQRRSPVAQYRYPSQAQSHGPQGAVDAYSAPPRQPHNQPPVAGESRKAPRSSPQRHP